jgi:threonine/homoserine/homoserine lactone efflux protein
MEDRFITLIICGTCILALWVVVLGLIFCDLWAGVRKAKKAGIYRTSDGYKKTIDKLARYYNMMLPLALMDCAMNGLLFYLYYFYHYDLILFPLFSLAGAGYVGWVEIHSIFEPTDIKEKKNQQDYVRALKAIIADHDPKSIIDILTKIQEEKKDESK